MECVFWESVLVPIQRHTSSENDVSFFANLRPTYQSDRNPRKDVLVSGHEAENDDCVVDIHRTMCCLKVARLEQADVNPAT